MSTLEDQLGHGAEGRGCIRFLQFSTLTELEVPLFFGGLSLSELLRSFSSCVTAKEGSGFVPSRVFRQLLSHGEACSARKAVQ